MPKKKTTTKKATKKVAKKKSAKSMIDLKEEFIEADASLENLEYADGKVRDDLDLIEEKEKLYGIDRTSPFNTGTKKLFERNLNRMTRESLMSMTERVGCRAYSDLEEQKEELMRAFVEWARANGGNSYTVTGSIKKGGSKNSEELEKLKQELKKKSLSELQESAARLGFNPSFDRDRLISVITNEYLKQ